MEWNGGCLCGAVCFRVTAEPLMAYYCHCTMCQKNGGGPFMAGATVPIEAFAFTKGEPKAYESSPGFVRLSCGECGSALGFQAKNDPKWADFSLGCLDDPNAITPRARRRWRNCGSSWTARRRSIRLPARAFSRQTTAAVCPLWVISGHPAPHPFMSAIGGEADIQRSLSGLCVLNVRFRG
jgi:hypothetical protein